MIRILKGLVVAAVAVFSFNNPAAAAGYLVRAIHSVEQIVVSVVQSAGQSPGAPGPAVPSSPGPGAAGSGQ